MSEQINLKELKKKEIRSLLLSSKNGLPLSELEQVHRDVIGDDIPYRRLGYSTLKDFIYDIPDVVSWKLVYGKVVFTAVPDASTKHIANLVARQKPPKRKKGRRPGAGNPRFVSTRFVPNAPVCSRPPAAATSWKFNFDTTGSHGTLLSIFRGQVKELLFTYPTGLPFNYFDDKFEEKFGNRPPVQKLGYNNSTDLIQSMPDIATLERTESSHEVMIYAKLGRRQQATNLLSTNKVTENDCIEDNFSDDDEQSDAFEEVALTRQQKAKIQQVLAAHPNGLKASRFSSAFKQMFQCDPDLMDFLTVVDLMASIPDTVAMERPSSGDWLLFDARTYKQSASACTDQSRNQKEDMMHIIPTIIDKFPHGLLQRDLPAQFEAHTGQLLDCAQLGCSSLDDVIYQLKDRIAVHYKGKGEVLLTVKRSTFDPPSSMTVAQRDLLAPQDAVIMGQRFCPLPLPPVSSDYVTVCVSNVDSPGQFWLQLCSYTRDLNSLMDELQEYHNHALDCYKVPNALLQTGLLCAGLYTDLRTDWHRCIVTGFQDPFVEVFYVDYGTTAFASRSAIRLLRSKYLSLPAQAIAARLTNTYPVRGGWSKEAFGCFMKMVEGQTLLARVTYVGDDEGQPKLSVCLCDTSGEEDVHIQDVLVRSGFAIHQQDCYDSRFPAQTTGHERPGSNSSQNNLDLAARSSQNDLDLAASSNQNNPDPGTCSSEHHNNFNDVLANGALHGSLAYNSTNLVKFIQLTSEHSIHLIEINQRFYVNSTEVSALLWDEDIVKTELCRCGNVKIGKLMLTKKDDKELVVALARASVGGVVHNGLLRSVVTLYELPSVLTILNLFDHGSNELKSAVERLIMKNPYSRSPLALGATNFVSSEDDDVCDEASLNKKEQELSHLLSCLSSQRKVILAEMQRSQTAEQSRLTVDRLTEIESQQECAHRLLNELGARRRHNFSGSNGVVQHLDENEENYKPSHHARDKIPVVNIPRAVVTHANETLRYPLNPSKGVSCDSGLSASPSTPSLSALFSQMTMTPSAAVTAAGYNYPGLRPSALRMNQFGLNGFSQGGGVRNINVPTAEHEIGVTPKWNRYLQWVAHTDVNTLASVTFGGASALGMDTLQWLAKQGGLSGR